MNKGFIYIVSDGVGDVFKFGFTTDPFSRLCKYNSTECLRPVRFDVCVEYQTERESRDIEILLKKIFDGYYLNKKTKPEVVKDCDFTRTNFNKIIESSNYVRKQDKNIGFNKVFDVSTTSEGLNYEETLKKIVNSAISSGFSEQKIFESIVNFGVGYEFDKTPQVIIKENRRKKLIKVNNVELFYDTKPKLIERFQRLALLDFEFGTNCF